jgi:anti-sigma regulatory factor (Ser/Thr protein kinase)
MEMFNFDHERRVSLPLTDEAPSSVRHWFAERSRFPLDVHDRIVLLLSELVANSVTHSGLEAPDEVEVSVREIPGGLHVEVVDHGVGIDNPKPREPEHFGLRFVDTQTDRWGYTNDPTRVWFEITGDGR